MYFVFCRLYPSSPSHHGTALFASYPQSTDIYRVPQCTVCPLVGIGTLPPPLSPASVPLPPELKGGRHTRLRVRGWGSPNSEDWRKSLSLCLLCAPTCHLPSLN